MGVSCAHSFALGLAACSGAAQPSPVAATADISTYRLSAEGLGPIRIGMSGDALRALFEGRIDETEINPNHPDCGEWLIANSASVSLFDNAVARISTVYDAGILTTEGVGIGSTAASVRAAYPNAQRRGAEYTPAPGHELIVYTDPENYVGLRFEIGEDERVTAIHAGGDLMNIEGCAGL